MTQLPAASAAEGPKKVLICGASIAGPTLAFWLKKYGYSVVVIEKSTVFRTTGQNVDIEGPRQEVIKLMGLEKAVAARNTRERGVRLVDGRGTAIAILPKGATPSLTSAYEILRGDLSCVIYDATKNDCDYRFGTTITALDQSASSVSVTFNDGSNEEFDLVVCAEGIGSSTRRLVMPDAFRFRYMGIYASYFRIPRDSKDDEWASLYNGKGGTFILLRPVHENDTTVLITFLRAESKAQELDAVSRKRLLREVLSGAGGPADRVLANLDHDKDFYLGPMSQIIGSRWSQGRFVLTGDAAYCPSAFGGKGTPLALVGAYVLAGELSKHAEHAAAFQSYEQIMRPYVEGGGSMSPAAIRFAHPKSALSIWLLRSLARLVASRPTQAVLRRFGSGGEDGSQNEIHLPQYA